MLVEDHVRGPEDARQASAAKAPRMPRAALYGWAVLGLIGAAVTAYAGTRLTGGSNAIRWWFHAPVPSGHEPAKVLFWAGVVALCGAWLGLGMTLNRSSGLSPKSLWFVGAAWCLPFLLGPPLFSHDLYSYIAQGTLVHLGHSPYHEAPIALGHLGHRHVLDGVDPFWRKTTAPYGPLFLGVVSLIVGAAGSHLVLNAVLVRLFDLIGIVVLAVFAPRLARALGADPRRALWLAMLSPLVWLQLVSNAHNDALMVGLMVAGVTLAVERKPLIGIAVCAVAATVKVPAVAAIVFIVVAWARELPSRQDRFKAVGKAALVTVAAAGIITAITGLSLAWISTGLFSTPGRVRLAITPATAVGYTIAHALHGVGVPLNGKQFEATLSHITFAITGLFGIFLLYRTRWENMVRRLGWLLLAIAIGGPAAWPWYFTWGLALLAACPGIQFSRVIPLAVVASAFIVIPTGQLAIPLGTSPEMVAFYLLVLAAAVWYWGRRLPRRAAMLANP